MEKLLVKYLQGKCSDEEKVRVTRWLDADSKNMKEYVALRKLTDIMIWHSDFAVSAEKKIGMSRFIPRSRKYIVEILKIAAIFILGILVTRYIVPGKKEAEPAIVMQTLHVPAGQRAQITLEDGTKVWLNANSTLSFPTHFTGGTRKVSLDGEGFFDVTSDHTNPFIVETAKYNVKVWGTRFNLLAYSESENFETALLEGDVEILSHGHTSGSRLKPAQRFYLKEGRIKVGPIRHMDYFLWTEGLLSFDDAPFSEVMKQLELYFDLDIEVKNRNSISYRCSGKFRTKDGVEHILKVLQVENRFKYRIEEKLNKITIE